METNTPQRILALIEQEIGVAVTEQTPIECLGIDSLDFIALVQEIRHQIGPISTDKAVNARTVADIIAAVQIG